MSIKKRISNAYEKPTDYFKDFYEWPQIWQVIAEDLVIGENLLEMFKPFIEMLIAEGLSVKTVKKHMLNLTLLGAEIIRRLNDDDEANRKLTPKKLLLKYINEYEGPLIHFWDPNIPAEEANLNAFDGTCRKLYKFTFPAN